MKQDHSQEINNPSDSKKKSIFKATRRNIDVFTRLPFTCYSSDPDELNPRPPISFLKDPF